MGRFEEAAKALVGEGVKSSALASGIDENSAGRVLWEDPEGAWTVKDVLAHLESAHRGLLSAAQGTVQVTPGRDLRGINEERRRERRDWSLDRVRAELEAARAAAAAHLGTLPDADWERTCRTSSGREWRLGELAWTFSSHEREHREQIESALGRRAPGGRVAWLNVSKGGVPKLPIHSARLGELGLEGDRHRARMHGGPTAALCLFSLEVIQRLRAEGHPIGPGTVGENVTVSGIDWASLQPGDRLNVGGTLVEVTRYTAPCKNIAESFVDGQFGRIDAKRYPGEARVYASVIRGGEIAVGDPVTVAR